MLSGGLEGRDRGSAVTPARYGRLIHPFRCPYLHLFVRVCLPLSRLTLRPKRASEVASCLSRLSLSPRPRTESSTPDQASAQSRAWGGTRQSLARGARVRRAATQGLTFTRRADGAPGPTPRLYAGEEPEEDQKRPTWKRNMNDSCADGAPASDPRWLLRPPSTHRP